MKKKIFDPWLVIIYLFLVSLGIILVYSSTYTFSFTRTGDPFFLFKRHLIGIGLGLAAFLGGIFFPVEKIRIYLKYIVPLTVILLLFALRPGLSQEAGGANRWIDLGFFSFQPSEVAKLTIIFYLASILEKKQEYIKEYLRGVLPPFLICVIIAGIVLFQKDFSTTVFLLIITLVMLYVGGTRFINIFLSLLITLPALFPFVLSSGYRLNRIKMLLNIDKNPSASYQLVQALEAFKRGGLFGMGPGKGAKTVPYVFNDFIFSVSGEELGLVGSFIILLLFMFLWQRGMSVVRQHRPNSFHAILAFGLTFLLVTQALLNIMVNLAIIFPTGITLPFISYGRTSFIVSSAAIGFLIQLSKKQQDEGSQTVSVPSGNLQGFNNL
jgi:cell division protein FtsW